MRLADAEKDLGLGTGASRSLLAAFAWLAERQKPAHRETRALAPRFVRTCRMIGSVTALEGLEGSPPAHDVGVLALLTLARGAHASNQKQCWKYLHGEEDLSIFDKSCRLWGDIGSASDERDARPSLS